MTIPSPTVLHFRLEPDAVKGSGYADNDALFDDLGKAYRQAVKAFYDAGCRYLQFDDTAWAYLCSTEQMEKAKARGLKIETLAKDYARVLNESIKDKPADMVITTHVCRGNFRSTFISSGGYEPIAETMLGGVQLRRLLPGIRFRSRRRLRAAAVPAQGQQDRGARADHLQERRAGNQGRHQAPDRRSRPNMSISTSLRSQRNAALPRPRKATFSPRTSNGQSCAWWSNSPTRCGENNAPLLSSPRARGEEIRQYVFD